MKDGDELIRELDKSIADSHRNNPPHEMLRIQSEIAAYRYTLATMVAEAEGEMIQSEHTYDLYIVRERISLQMEDKKLAHNKATDQIEKRPAAEELFQMALRAKIDFKALKMKYDASESVLQSLAQRIKAAMNEEMTSRYQQVR